MPHPTLTLLYDGSCSLCAWEMHKLKRHDLAGHLEFIDIQSAEFNAAIYGVTLQALMQRLHGITADGRMIVGVETLIATYRAVGWWWTYLPLELAPRWLADRAYGWFADHRYELSRRFGHCFGEACGNDRCTRRP